MTGQLITKNKVFRKEGREMSWIADTVEKTFENYQRNYQKYCDSLDKLEETQKEWKEKTRSFQEFGKGSPE